MKDAVLAALTALQPELQRRGVTRAGLFGSVARGEASPQSDIDIFVDLDRDAPLTLLGYVGIQHLISDHLSPSFGRSVDVICTEKLRPAVRANIERDAIIAF
jgi:predicted nucleotidyltransferase